MIKRLIGFIGDSAMLRCSRHMLASLLIFTVSLTAAHAKPIEILLWHSLAGHIGSQMNALINGFNHSQTEYVIKGDYKGDYIESLTSFAAAFRAHQPPALIQIFEVGTATMLAPTGIIKPVDKLMQDEGLVLPEASFFPAIRAYYSEHGHLMAMPFNTSVPVIFYNADAVASVGYSAASFPRTWDELERLAFKLKQAGFSCAYTSAYPAWILIEAFSAIHGLPMIDLVTQKAIYNNEKIIQHLVRLLRWQQLHYFEYGGRTDDATVLFTSGRCPLLSQSSGVYNSLTELVPFNLGMAALPLDKKTSDRRFNNAAGGAALWVVANQSPEIYHGIARFFSYLADPAVQQRWHENTGYLPLGTTGIYEQLAKESKHPSLRLAQVELVGNDEAVSTLRLGPQNQIRVINDEALEEIFAGLKSPKRAMDEAVIRANHVLQRFAQNTSDH